MIELPGHEVIVKGAVFAQPTPDYASKYITVVNLFDESRPIDTWNYSRQKVEGFFAVKSFGYQPKTPLESLISKLPKKVQRNFADYKSRYQTYFLGDIEDDENPGRFLEICLGVMPLETLAQGNGDPYWYLRSLQELIPGSKEEEQEEGEYGIGELLHVGIRVENNLLPAKNRIVNLVGESVSQSKILHIYPGDYDPEEVMSVINNVYNALDQCNLKNLRVLNDLEDFAVSAMQGILADVKDEKRTRRST